MTQKPAIVEALPSETRGKSGYYGKDGMYFTPNTQFRDHPVYQGLVKHNVKYNYKPGLHYTNIAEE
jgi:hypothetical protein